MHGAKAIRAEGEAAACEMDAAKSLFVELGLAGEPCRSIIGIMEELVRRNQGTDLSSYCLQLEDEASVLGVLPIVRSAIERLRLAAQSAEITQQVLQEVWDAFGPTFNSPSTSGVGTVAN
jgi:hypothetical protein